MSIATYRQLPGCDGPAIAVNVWANAPARDLRTRYSAWLKSLSLDIVPATGVFGDGCLRILWNAMQNGRPSIQAPGLTPETEVVVALAEALSGKPAAVTALNRVFIPLKGSQPSEWLESSQAVATALGFQRMDYFPIEFCGAKKTVQRWMPDWSLGMLVYLPARTTVTELGNVLEDLPAQVTGDVYATLDSPEGVQTHLFVRF